MDTGKTFIKLPYTPVNNAPKATVLEHEVHSHWVMDIIYLSTAQIFPHTKYHNSVYNLAPFTTNVDTA